MRSTRGPALTADCPPAQVHQHIDATGHVVHEMQKSTGLAGARPPAPPGTARAHNPAQSLADSARRRLVGRELRTMRRARAQW